MVLSSVIFYILSIIAFVAIEKFVYVGSTVLNRRMRIIGRMLIFVYSLELLMMVLVHYGLLPLFANSIALLPIFRLFMVLVLILAIITSLVLCIHLRRSSLSIKFEIGGDDEYEDTETWDDEENPEVHYYFDLVAVNNDGTMDREQQQHK